MSAPLATGAPLTPEPESSAPTLPAATDSGIPGLGASDVSASAPPASEVPSTRTIRVISVHVQTARWWRSDATKISRGYHNGKRPDLAGGEAARCRRAAATAELLGVPVGIVTRVREEVV